MPFTKNAFLNVCFYPYSLLGVNNNSVVRLGRKTSQRTGKELTCVYCRARWVFPGPSGGPSGGATVLDKAKGGYVNLAAVAGFSPVRDTSTCRAI